MSSFISLKFRSPSGFALISMSAASLVSGVLVIAFVQYVGSITRTLAQSRDVGAKEDIRRYLRERADCPSLINAAATCTHGQELEVWSRSPEQILVRSESTSQVQTPDSYLAGPFRIRAICTTDPNSPSRYRIEVLNLRKLNNQLWEVLFANTPLC